MNESARDFVKRYKPSVICVKVWEDDHSRYDWCIVEKGNSFVLGSGASPERAWSAAAIWLKIKMRKQLPYDLHSNKG